MRRTGALICGLAAFAALAPAAGAEPRRGTWWGQRGDVLIDFSYALLGSRPLVKAPIVEPRRSCKQGDAEMVPSGFVRGNRFTIRQSLLGGKVQRTLKGRFTSSRRAVGTYREIDRTFGRDCDTGTLRWSAGPIRRRPVAEGVWNGSASGAEGGLPTSFRVQFGGRMLDRVAGEVPGCSTGTRSYRGPAEAVLIRPDGSFTVPLPLGGHFAGRFGARGRTAAGDVRVVFMTVDGEPTCESGRSWSASR